jgi:hypothetical protein
VYITKFEARQIRRLVCTVLVLVNPLLLMLLVLINLLLLLLDSTLVNYVCPCMVFDQYVLEIEVFMFYSVRCPTLMFYNRNTYMPLI